MTRLVLVSVFIILCAVQSLNGVRVWADNNDNTDHQSLIPPSSAVAGPIFIATIYPVLNLDKALLEIMPAMEDAYDFWGKELISSQHAETYFPSPLSYPYRFSRIGLDLLRQRLMQVDRVNHSSIEIKTYPNIPRKWHYTYEPDELRTLLIEESYLRFTLRGWPLVTFMKFPTFVVVAFDHTGHPVRSYDDYKAVTGYWRERIEQLRHLEDLQETLGISRKNRRWASIPILTFVSSTAYQDVSFFNRYFYGSDPEPQRTQRFLREISLRSASVPSIDGAVNGAFSGCQSVFHEWDTATIWRFYYSAEPLFYDGPHWPLTVIGPTGPEPMLTRVLRVALFANLTLPDVLEDAKVLDDRLKRNLTETRALRDELFESFSLRRINALHVTFSEKLRGLPNIIVQIDRIERAMNGIHQLYRYLNAPLSSSFDINTVDTKIPEEQPQGQRRNPCLEIFQFEKRRNVVNDAQKVDRYANEISIYLELIKRNAGDITEQVKGGIELLENRRSLIEN
jgi:hypothetical protein